MMKGHMILSNVIAVMEDDEGLICPNDGNGVMRDGEEPLSTDKSNLGMRDNEGPVNTDQGTGRSIHHISDSTEFFGVADQTRMDLDEEKCSTLGK